MLDRRPAFAGREVTFLALVVGLVLLALAGRYDYHRDELYFLEAGKHLAWGYRDQPPLVPLLARLMDIVAPGSLMALRLPATLVAATVVLLTGLIARELGASRGGQVLAAGSAGVSGLVLATGHLLSTTTIALSGWVMLTYALVRALTGAATFRLWLLAGITAGLTIQVNPLLVAFLVVLVAALVVVGPRDLLRAPGPYAGAFVAVVVAAPYVFWQAAHGFPQLDVGRASPMAVPAPRHPGSRFCRFSCCWSARGSLRSGSQAWCGCCARRRFGRSGCRTSGSPQFSWRWAASRTTWPACTPCCSQLECSRCSSGCGHGGRQRCWR